MSDVVSVQLSQVNKVETSITPIHFQGKEVAKVNAQAFGEHSAKFHREAFREATRGLKEPVVIVSDVDEEIVKQFADACQGRRVEVQRVKLDQLFCLAEEWEVTDMIQALREDGNFADLLIRLLLRRRETDSARDLERALHDQFTLICNTWSFQENILQIGLPVLQRVFLMNDCDLVRDHLSEVFPFLQQCVDQHFGASASVLFSGIDVRQLNEAELNWMKDNPNVDHSYMCQSYFQVIMDLRRALKAKEEQCQSLLSTLENERALYDMTCLLYDTRQKLQDQLQTLSPDPRT